jgi:Na+/melibiose symporter-like transporter
MGWIAAILGGSLAATSHATKMTTRAAVNTSPEPFSNIAVSLAEDGLVVFMLWLSATHPVAFAIVLIVSIVLAVILLVVLVRFLRKVLAGLREFFKGRPLPRELG